MLSDTGWRFSRLTSDHITHSVDLRLTFDTKPFAQDLKTDRHSSQIISRIDHFCSKKHQEKENGRTFNTTDLARHGLL